MTGRAGKGIQGIISEKHLSDSERYAMSIATQSLTVRNHVHRAFAARPVSIGVPWPEGLLADEAAISLRDAGGQAVPVAATVLNRWPDGSLQWTLLDFALDLSESGEERLTVVAGDGLPAAPACPVVAATSGDGIRLYNGLVELAVPAAGPLVESWRMGDAHIVTPGGFDLVVTDADGRDYSLARDANRRVAVEHNTPLRAVVRVDAKHVAADGATLLDGWVKFTVTAGSPDVLVAYHFRNRELPVPGVRVRGIRLDATLGVPPDAERALTHRNRGRQYLTEPIRVPDDFEIFSSDTPLIDHYQALHADAGTGGVYIREGEVLRQDLDDYPWFLVKKLENFDPSLPLKFRGIYQERAVWPYLGFAGPDHAVAVVPLDMTGMHPKSLRIDGRQLTYAIWPEWAGPLDITQGAGRTHEIVFAGLPAGATDFDFQTRYLAREVAIYSAYGEASDPVSIIPDIAWIRACKVFHVHMLAEYLPDEHFRFERKLAAMQVYGNPGSSTGTPANGMWHYGDYAPICNNDNNASLRHLQDYLRSGQWEHARRALNACRHIIDVDYVDFSIYPYQHRGMCAHCAGHNQGAVYPSHEWISDLFIAYAISGDPELKSAALNMCENVLYWVNDPEGFPIVSVDHREAGQPMINLAWAYEFNRDPRYLAACEKIVREVYMAAGDRYGRMLVPKPTADSIVYLMLYGDWACWKGMFYYWEITRDEVLKAFFLRECDRRIDMAAAPVGGDPRAADVEMATFAYYMTGDRRWVERLGRIFRAMFDASKWDWTWEHGMYYVKLAFDFGLIHDDDVRT